MDPADLTSHLFGLNFQCQAPKLSPEEIQKKREEAERKARRGEIDPMQEFAFQVIGQVSS
jgi:hypothetical protein